MRQIIADKPSTAPSISPHLTAVDRGPSADPLAVPRHAAGNRVLDEEEWTGSQRAPPQASPTSMSLLGGLLMPRPLRRLVLASGFALLLLFGLYVNLYQDGNYQSLRASLLPLAKGSYGGSVTQPDSASAPEDLGSLGSIDTDITVPTDTATPTTLETMAKPTAPAPTVTIRQGTYVGTTLLASTRYPKAVEAFRGVPYGQDTGGENRFRPPKPVPPSTETFDALAFGPVCPSDGVLGKGVGEDCLNLNVYRPAGLVNREGYAKEGNGTQKARLPVVVYIHGGGFNVGRGIERNMASFVAWAEAPIVAVNFNYRVGALGFLPSAVTAREGLLNLGLRDQQLLLEWVRDNIEAFGGDPGNVTIMGLSAGAHSVGHHIMHYARSSSPAPFHKAILESGATTARAVFYPTHPRHLVQFREFLIAAGADGIPESQIFSHLRTLPLETIVTASKAVWDKYVEHVTWPFQPVIDGPNPLANSSHTQPDPIIPTLPITSWLNGSHLHIPILTGYNTNEGTMFIPPKADTSSDFRSFFQSLIPSMTEADLDRLEALYPDPLTSPADNNPYKSVPRGMGRQWARLDAAYSHYAYICPVLQTAHFMSKNSSKKDRVYVYRYAATSTWGTANHVDEVPAVVYDMNVLRGKPGLEQVAKAMHGMWARFVASPVGDPNPNPTSTFDSDSDSASGEGNGRSKKAAAVEWPVFLSPFSDDGPTWSASPADRRNRRVADGSSSGSGSIMVFGEGNNEREPGKLIKNRGIPAQVQELSEFEKEACRFWWERVWLSQGLGNAHRTAKL